MSQQLYSEAKRLAQADAWDVPVTVVILYVCVCVCVCDSVYIFTYVRRLTSLSAYVSCQLQVLTVSVTP